MEMVLILIIIKLTEDCGIMVPLLRQITCDSLIKKGTNVREIRCLMFSLSLFITCTRIQPGTGMSMHSTTFSKTGKEGRGDTSVWTDTPSERAQKAKMK